MQPPCCRSDHAHRRRLALLLGVAAVAFVWLLALPWAGSWPGLRDSIRRREARGINAGAMYYTELEAMPDIAARVREVHRRDGGVFWEPTFEVAKEGANDAHPGTD